MSKEEKENESNCVMELSSNSYRVISIAEVLVLQARKIIKPVYIFRNDPLLENPSVNLLLATAICGRYIHIHEQLLIIREMKKDSLLELAKCYDVLVYEVCLDYYNSKYDSKEYLDKFKKENNYTAFVSRWLNLPTKNTFSHDYFEKCMSILK
jgi:hypothetical protein